jgi:hypothetical protein
MNSEQPIVINRVAGDTAPNVTFPISRAPAVGQPPVPVDLTGASVNFLIADPATGIQNNADGAVCIIVDAEAGQVEYTWNASDTPAMGVYNALLVITWADGRTESTPLLISATPGIPAP